jgi:hypothetical protein
MARSAPRTSGLTSAAATAVVTMIGGLAIGAALAQFDLDSPGPLRWGAALALAGLAAVALLTAQRSERQGDPAARAWFVAGIAAGIGALVRVTPIGRIADTADLSTIAGIDGDQLRIAWLLVGAGVAALATPAARALWRSLDPDTRPRFTRAGTIAGLAVASSMVLELAAGVGPAGALLQLVAGGLVLAVALDALVLRPTRPGLRLEPLPGTGLPSLADLVEAHRRAG